MCCFTEYSVLFVVPLVGGIVPADTNIQLTSSNNIYGIYFLRHSMHSPACEFVINPWTVSVLVPGRHSSQYRPHG
jgi:hypothetical protein